MPADSDRGDYEQLSSNELDGNFTNVSGLAHLTKKKTPPPLPPSRHATHIEDISSAAAAPPSYSAMDTKFYDSNYMNISIDQDIQNRVTHTLNQVQGDSKDFGSLSEVYKANKVDFFTDLPKTKRETGEDGVLLPLNSALFESYLAPLLMICSQIPQFNNAILRHQYFTFPTSPNWWNKEEASRNLLIVQELQRLVAFLNGSSNRAFASLFNLTRVIGNLANEEFESLSDFHNFFNKEVGYFLSMINPQYQNAWNDLFKMVIVQKSAYEEDDDTGNGKREEDTHTYFNIPVLDNDGLFNISNIYEVLNITFTVNAYDQSPKIYLQKPPGVITVVFESGSDNLQTGFKLDRIFYPQIYTYEHRNILKNVDIEIERCKLRQRELTRNSFHLRAFNGKSVRKFLTETKTHLANQSVMIGVEEEKLKLDSGIEENTNTISEKDKYAAAAQSLNLLSSHIGEGLRKNDQEMAMLTTKIGILESSKFNIDQLLNEQQKSTFEAWILTGVVLTCTQFYYLNKKSSDTWTGVTINGETCKSYEKTRLQFRDVQDIVKQYSLTEFGEGMVLVYAKESTFYSDAFEPLNPVLQKFVSDDNERLQQQLDILHVNEILDPDDRVSTSQFDDADGDGSKDSDESIPESTEKDPFSDPPDV